MEEHLYYSIGEKGYIRVRVINGITPAHYIIDNYAARQYSGYRLIDKDLKLIKDAVTTLSTLDYKGNEIICQSLTFLIIVTYGKCFAKADGRKIKLEKDTSLKNSSKEELSMHQELLLLRNQYVAHAGSSKFETNPVIITRTKLTDGEYGYLAHDSAVYMSAFKLNLSLIQSLLNRIIEFVDDKINDSYENLMKFVVTKISESDFIENSFVPDLKKLIKLDDINKF